VFSPLKGKKKKGEEEGEREKALEQPTKKESVF